MAWVAVVALAGILVIAYIAYAYGGRPSASPAPIPTPVPDNLRALEARHLYLYHDDERSVTCWVALYSGSAIFCMTDREIEGEAS